ncbi:hypothetical protein D7X33_35830, partial [Butyricicoccus sp. 1XD8-22]
GDDANVLNFSAVQLEEAKSAKKAGEVFGSFSSGMMEFAKKYFSEPIDFNNLSETAQTDFDKLNPEEQDKLKNLTPESIVGVNNIISGNKELEAAQSSLTELTSDISTFNNIVTARDKNEAIYNSTKSNLVSSLLSAASTQEEKDAINNASDTELLQTAQYLEENGASVSAVTLTSSTDVDNMVDKIKKFVETYNGLVTTINGKLKESYDRNYPPLTDEQKEDMSEDEIEKWEAKAKTGLLRNDSILT